MGNALSSVFETRSASVLIVETLSGVRPMMTAAIRAFGFNNVMSIETLTDALDVLATQKVDWIITSCFSDGEKNALQLLRLLRTEPSLKKIHVSLLVGEDEQILLPKAYSLGLLSDHKKPFNTEAFSNEIKTLLEKISAQKGNFTLVGAEYLRPVLKAQRKPSERLKLEQALNKEFSENIELLLHLAEAHFLVNDIPSARALLWQITQRQPDLSSAVETLNKSFPVTAAETGKSPWKDFKLKTCVIVDPDSTTRNRLTDALNACGATEVITFEHGEDCWNWLKENKEPDLLILEWRIPRLSGPFLIQRCRCHGFHMVSILVHSSLVQKNDQPLLKEMGVTEVLLKPFREDEFLNCVAATVGQSHRPTEIKSIELKIRSLLASGQTQEAINHMQLFLSKSGTTHEASKSHLEAEFAFALKSFPAAKNMALKSMRLGNKSVSLLNLLGKTLMQLREFTAALQIFQRTDSIAPNSLERLCAIAETQQELGQTDAAMEVLKKASSLDSGSQLVANASVNIGLASGNSSLVEGAIDKFDPKAKIMAFVNNKAVAHSRAGEFAEAIKLYENALAALPPTLALLAATIRYNMALAYGRNNNVAGVISSLESIPETSDLTLAKKISSLLKRAQKASSTKTPLLIVSETAIQIETEKIDEGAASVIEQFTQPVKKECISCHKFYIDDEPDGDLVKSMLATTPRFKSRI